MERRLLYRSFSVRASFSVPLVALVACAGHGPWGGSPAPCVCGGHDADAPPRDRIGDVLVSGAKPAAVPQKLGVLEGTHDNPERTDRIIQIATDGLRTAGYAKAQIAVTRQVGCHVDLHVAVTLGPRYKIAPDPLPTPRTSSRSTTASRSSKTRSGTVNTVGGVYIEYRLVRALRELERRYHDAGWLDAKIDAPQPTYDVAGKVSITVPVTAGPRFRIGNVKAGRCLVARTRQTVLETLGLRAGSVLRRSRASASRSSALAASSIAASTTSRPAVIAMTGAEIDLEGHRGDQAAEAPRHLRLHPRRSGA